MKTLKTVATTTLLISALGASSIANAALVGRDLDGNLATAEAYYDDQANLTWLADANAAGMSMSWTTANNWAAALDIDGVAGADGWRLADTDPAVAGYNQTTTEMGNLFYNVLGGVAGSSITTTHNANYDLFSNVQSNYYWSATESGSNHAWRFGMQHGIQGGNAWKGDGYYAWAVQSGDVGVAVSAVPVPAAVWLFGSGLIGLVSFARRKKA